MDEEAAITNLLDFVQSTTPALPALPEAYSNETAALPVPTISDHISFAEFEKRYRHKSLLKLKGYAQHWPAMHKWSRDTMKAILGENRSVTVLISKDNQHFFKNALCNEAVLTLGQVIEQVFNHEPTKLYCRLPLLDELVPDIVMPTEMITDDQVNPIKPANCGVWISSQGNITPLHYDLCHGFLVQIVGKKRWQFFSPDDYRSLYPASTIDPNPLSSNVTLEKWQAGDEQQRKTYPKVAQAERYECVLEPGDMMYTPPFWWHHVETLEPSISVLLPFDKRLDEPVHPCAW